MSINTINKKHSLDALALQKHQDENFSTLKGICNSFYTYSMWSSYPWQKETHRKIAENPNIFSLLDITVPPVEMKEIYDEYHVIALRQLQSPDLLLFCGNKPVYSSFMRREYTQEARETDHGHEGLDTLDVDILMNPCCVSNWPLDSKAAAYISSEKQYSTVTGEFMSIISDGGDINTIKNCFSSLHSLLKEGGISSDNVYTHNPANSFYSRLAFKYSVWGHDQSLFSKLTSLSTWTNALSPAWYAQSYNWLSQLGNENEELNIIQTLANSSGLTATISEPAVREGVWGGNGFHRYEYPVSDYKISYEKQKTRDTDQI